MNRPRIAIATLGRFHVLDLARELCALGYDVVFWTMVPRDRAIRFGLPSAAHRRLPRLLTILAGIERYAWGCLATWAGKATLEIADRAIAKRLEACDVFIGMSGLCIESAAAARKNYGAKVYIERGSHHVLSQKAILEEIRKHAPRAKTVAPYAIKRELASYAVADRVVIPSMHVEKSFIEHGFEPQRLFRNPYGVELAMFPPTPAPQGRPATLLFAGTWCFRKGVDVLEAAWRTLPDVELWHVGPVGDAPLPVAAGFVHIDAVPQWRLREYYARAHVFVLASREEGLSLVQAQALASGLPLVCTERTGGADLQEMLEDPLWVRVVPCDDASALAAALRDMLVKAMGMRGDRTLLGATRDTLGYRAYAMRYAAELTRAMEHVTLSGRRSA